MNPYSLFYVPAVYATAGTNEFYHVSGAVLRAEDWLEAYPQVEIAAPEIRHCNGVLRTPQELHSETFAPDDDDIDIEERVKAALAVVPNDLSRDDWLRMAAAIKQPVQAARHNFGRRNRHRAIS